METGAASMEKVRKTLKKLKLELPYDPAFPILGTYPKEMKTLTQKDTCSPMYTAALFIIAKCPSMDE